MVLFPLPSDRVEKSLTDFGLNGDADYSKNFEKDLDLCLSGLILTICTSGSVSEGGYSLSVNDKEALLKIRSLLLTKWGVNDNSDPLIEDATGLW